MIKDTALFLIYKLDIRKINMLEIILYNIIFWSCLIAFGKMIEHSFQMVIDGEGLGKEK